ncbi:rod shape-determining protein [Mycoplasmatota bacterium]|nr:rod shape-determining protein [Mycoplasmatota bacterium]
MAKKERGYKIGIDLGTANTLVYLNGQGLIFNEPSCVAFDRRSNECIAVGQKAKNMLGREHQLIRVVKPLEGGVVADLDATKALLEFVFEQMAHINIEFGKTTLLICCPSEVSQIERVALLELSEKLGVKDVFIEEEVKAGAIGAGLDIFAPKGTMVIDIGGGSTDIGVLALGDLVVSESIRVAGNYIDQAIIKFVKLKYGMAIGTRTAESIKKTLGTLKEDLVDEKEYIYAGRDIVSGLPKRMIIKQSEVRNLMIKAFDSVAIVAKKVLEQTPPELASDIFEGEIVVNGGGALIPGIKEFFEDRLHLKVRVSENALTAIVDGTKYLLQNRGNYLVKPLD